MICTLAITLQINLRVRPGGIPREAPDYLANKSDFSLHVRWDHGLFRPCISQAETAARENPCEYLRILYALYVKSAQVLETIVVVLTKALGVTMPDRVGVTPVNVTKLRFFQEWHATQKAEK